MINALYNAFLWFWGFHRAKDPPVTGDEKITYLLRRQKQRFGWFWWIWAAGWISLPVWLTLHILEIGGF